MGKKEMMKREDIEESIERMQNHLKHMAKYTEDTFLKDLKLLIDVSEAAIDGVLEFTVSMKRKNVQN